MAKAFKPTRGLNAFTLQYVNSQCQHDSRPLKLVAKLHLLSESAKSLTDYFDFKFSVNRDVFTWDVKNLVGLNTIGRSFPISLVDLLKKGRTK